MAATDFLRNDLYACSFDEVAIEPLNFSSCQGHRVVGQVCNLPVLFADTRQAAILPQGYLVAAPHQGDLHADL